MPTKPLIKLPDIDGIKAGSASGAYGYQEIPIDYGKTVYGLQFYYKDGGSSPTDLLDLLNDDILVYKNKKEQRIHTAKELERLNAINGSQYGRRQVGSGSSMEQYMNIYFYEPWRKDKFDSVAGAWVVTPDLGWNRFWLKMRLAAAMPSTATLQIRAWVGDPVPFAKGQTQVLKKVYRDQVVVGGLSTDLVNLTAKDAYQAMYFKHPSGAGVITSLDLKVNGRPKVEEMARQDMIDHLTRLGMNPANSTSAGAFGYEWVADADDAKESAEPVDGATIWGQLKFDSAASGNVVIMSELIGPADV